MSKLQCRSVVIETINQFKMAHTSMPSTYNKCFITFICCGCAFGWVLTKQLPLIYWTMSIELTLKLWYLTMSTLQCSAVLEAVDPFKMAQTSMSNTCKVFYNLHMLWMCIWISPNKAIAPLIVKNVYWNHLEFWLSYDEQTKKCSAVLELEAVDPFKIAHTSM